MTSPQPVQPGAQGSVAIVGNHYQVGKKIGEGSFGVVFEGTNLLNGHIIAIKFEPRKSDAPQLRDEYRSYRILQGCPGIPQAYYYGTEGLHNVLCIDLLGPNLEDLFDLCGRKFTVKAVAMLAKQMIERVQCIHEKNLIYRDIKPDNFLLGLPGGRNADTIYMVDFGMAKLWRDPRTRQHIPYRERKSLSGTARYMSINTHLGREQSRRDDLEGLGHVFMYFLRGSLPWQGLKAANNKQKYERIGERKQTVPIAELCEGFPEEFSIYLNYVRKLGFEETPDYDFLKELFVKVLRSAGDVDDNMFDWKLLNSGKGWEANAKLPSNLLPQLAHHGNVQHRSRENTASPRQHRASAIPAMGGTSPGQPSPAGAMTPPPAALGRHASKHRKHQSAGPLSAPGMGGSQQTGPGSAGLIVGSARPSRAISPLQTQTQGGGTAGNPILMPSATGGPSSAQPSPVNSPAQPQHPYATGAGMHTPAPYARADYANGGRQSPNGVYGGNVPGGSGMIAQQSQQRNSVVGGTGQPGIGSRQIGLQQGLPEERSLPAPPPKTGLMALLRCRCE